MIKLKSYLLFSLAAIMAALGFNNAALASQKSLNVESPAGEPIKFETECHPQLLAAIQITKISDCIIRIIVDYMGYCGMSIKSAIPLSLFFNTWQNFKNVMQNDPLTSSLVPPNRWDRNRNEYIYNPVGMFAISPKETLIAYRNPLIHYSYAYIVNHTTGKILGESQLNRCDQVLHTVDRVVNGIHKPINITEDYLLQTKSRHNPRSFKVFLTESAQHDRMNGHLDIINDLNSNEKSRITFGVYERILAADSIGNGEIIIIATCRTPHCDKHEPMLITCGKPGYPKQDQENVLDQSRCYIMPDLLKSLRPACGNYYTYAQRVLAATSFGLGCWSVWNAYRNTASPRELGATVGSAVLAGLAAFKLYGNR